MLGRLLLCAFTLSFFLAGQNKVPLSAEEQAISDKLRGFRALADDRRAVATRELAFKIRELAGGPGKLQLATTLADLSTEGDFGRDNVQEVTNTLVAAMHQEPPRDEAIYTQLAQLSYFEGMKVDYDSELYRAAVARLEREDAARRTADFTLKDLSGHEWKLSGLRGKVVLLNFWATWCQPCRKEMPDLEALYARFGSKGLVVLAITDDERPKVESLAKQSGYTFPIVLDPQREASKLFAPREIPKSYVFDRAGKLVATAVDVRTRDQFLAMLAKAGLS